MKNIDLCEMLIYVKSPLHHLQVQAGGLRVAAETGAGGDRLDLRGFGFESPLGSRVVVSVKEAIVKEANKGKKKAERIGMTKKKLLKIFDSCYKEDCRKVEPERRRFLLMKTICFLGTKRFNDIQKLKKKDIVVGEDNRVKVWMERSKTDSKREGCQFVLTKSKIGPVSVTGLIQWYLRSLPGVPEGEAGGGSGCVLLRRQEPARQGEGAAGFGRDYVALRPHRCSNRGFQEGGLQERHHARRGMALFGRRLLH